MAGRKEREEADMARVTRDFCDKCGKQINVMPARQLLITKKVSIVLVDFAYGNQRFDLCRDCSGAVVGWIKDKKENPDA